MKQILERALRSVAALACGAAVLSACARVDTGSAGSTAAPGGQGNSFTHHHELRLIDNGDVSSLNPMFTNELAANWLDQMTMAYLLRVDRNNEVVPELATAVPSLANGGVSADGKTIRYHLRRHVVWSDGAPFTADDVVWTTGVVNDPKTNVTSRDGWDRIAKIDEPDKYTVVYHLRAPYSPFVKGVFTTNGAGPAILPKHLLEHTADINKDPYNSLPIGIGPFKFVKWARADHIEMVANPSYWRGRPKLQRVTYKIVPSRDTIMSELQTGEADLWPIAAPAYLPRIQKLSGFRLLRQPGYSFGHLDFNTSHSLVSDPAVRRALLLAWDRRSSRDKISHGVGILQDAVVSPRSPFYAAGLGFTEQNVAKANAMLDAAGWKRGPDGVRVKNRSRLNLELVSNSGSPDTDLRIELLRENWKAIGVTFVRKNYDPNLLFANYQAGGIIQNGKFDVVFFAWFPPGDGNLSTLYGCEQIPPKGQNVVHWCNARAQAAMDDFKTTFDPARQKRDDRVVQEELVRDTPTMVSTITEDLYVENTDLRGFHPNEVSQFDDMMNVDI
jgi:peptide/nickel transport system substrate-binding protein